MPSERSFRRIETLAVSVRGDLFVSDLSRVFRLDSRGAVERVFESEGQTVLGLAAGSAAELLLLASGEELSLVRLESSGERRVLLSPAEIATAPTTVATPG